MTTTLSLGVEVGVGELPGGNVVELSTEVGVLLGNDEDVDHVNQRETGKGPSETHDTLEFSFTKILDVLGGDVLGRHRGTRGQESLEGSSESLASGKEQ